MPLLTRLSLFLLACVCFGASGPVLLIGEEPGAWRKIFGAVGVPVTQATMMPPATIRQQVESGALAIVEGETEFADQMGIRSTRKKVPARSVVDVSNPRLPVIWEKAIDVPQYTLPPDAIVFTRERWTGAPLAAGLRRGRGAVLWTAVKPGPNGYERLPYLLQAMQSLGFEFRLRSNRLWAFFDSSYRTRADIEYFAKQWASAGIAALHVAAWHYNEPDTQRDEWLKRLIAICHREGILVYAWIELPHVSEKFWNDHPEWREKTGVLQDAHLDWRKLMNLANADCARAVKEATRRLIERFDWDGVNLGELYYESLEGIANPARFTPMNEDIRAEYRSLMDIDPITLLKPDAKAEDVTSFLTYRAERVRRMQEEWIGFIESIRQRRPHLDLALTHVDDRYDTRMRELIGADAARVLPLLKQHDFTFLVEDPATVWHLGPERYRDIAAKYAPLTPRQERLAIDINIVERFQDVYPTKQQTGVELFQLLHTAAAAFARVAIYFENSILKPDLPLLSAAGAAVTRFEQAGSKWIVESPRGVGIAWSGPALVDGRPWPVTGAGTIWLPPGGHVVEPGPTEPHIAVHRLTADLQSAAVSTSAVEFTYASSSRALAILSRRPDVIEVDGQKYSPDWAGPLTLVLPRGQHLVTLR